MKGNNFLQINQSTMQEAIQYWLENKVFKGEQSVRVKNVKGNSMHGTWNFEIDLEPKEDEE